MSSICGLSSYGRCEVLKRSLRGADLRHQASLSSPSNDNARTFLRLSGLAPMLDAVAKTSSFRVSTPSRRGVAAPLGRRPRPMMPAEL